LADMTMVTALRRGERIDTEMARVLAEKSEADRLRIAFRMWVAARKIVRASVMAEHPAWPPEQIDREVAVRMSHGLVNRVSR
jgi:hypothetical protein